MWPIELKTVGAAAPSAVSDPCLLGRHAGGEESNGILKCVRHVNDLCDARVLSSLIMRQISQPMLRHVIWLNASLAGLLWIELLLIFSVCFSSFGGEVVER